MFGSEPGNRGSVELIASVFVAAMAIGLSALSGKSLMVMSGIGVKVCFDSEAGCGDSGRLIVDRADDRADWVCCWGVGEDSSTDSNVGAVFCSTPVVEFEAACWLAAEVAAECRTSVGSALSGAVAALGI